MPSTVENNTLSSAAMQVDEPALKNEVVKEKKKKSKKRQRTPEEEKAHQEKKARKKALKRKAKEEAEADSESGSTRSEPPRKKAKPEVEAAAEAMDVEEETKGDPKDANGNPPLSNFDMTETTKAALIKRGVTHLFPIQANTFDLVKSGIDLIGRARTGTGKTLAFALPVIEQLLGSSHDPTRRGRHPKVLVMAPTRELAIQVAREFETSSPTLTTFCIYGGTDYYSQNTAMRNGIDIVVGTVGRIKDHIERNNLKLDNVDHLILDEADQMFDKGFQEEVELIMQKIREARGSADLVQTLLFSATLPVWIRKLATKYMKPNHKTIDLVGDNEQHAAKTVRHLLIPCHWQERASVLASVISCYCPRGGSTIIFTETKKEANDLALNSSVNQECQSLHGDIPQKQREQTMAAFRNGKFKVLVATDVAARGLDVSNVDLVIQCEPPQQAETYVHRSGRTGRAGNKGICVTFFTPKQLFWVQNIQRRAGFKFERVAVPQGADLIKSAIPSAIKAVEGVDEDVLTYFEETAAELMEKDGVKALARALAVITGHTEKAKKRSLLTSQTGWMTVQLVNNQPIRSLSFVWTAIRRYIFPNECDENVRGMKLTADRLGAVFDIPDTDKSRKLVESAASRDPRARLSFELIDTLPELEVRQAQQPERRGWQKGGRSRSAGGRSFGGRGRGGRGGRGRGGFRGRR